MSHQAARYDFFSRLMHWTIAAAMIYVTIVGYSLHFIADAGLYSFLSVTNMSLALVLTPLMIARYIWRFFRPEVPYGKMLKGHEKGMVHLLHEIFYLLIFVVLISGFLMLQNGFAVFGIIDFPRPVENLDVNLFFFAVHRVSCIALTAMIVLHIAAVIKRSYARQGILKRML